MKLILSGPQVLQGSILRKVNKETLEFDIKSEDLPLVQKGDGWRSPAGIVFYIPDILQDSQGMLYFVVTNSTISLDGAVDIFINTYRKAYDKLEQALDARKKNIRDFSRS